MSADNYYKIEKCALGRNAFVAMMRFSSDSNYEKLTREHCESLPHFASPNAAYQWALNQYAEYGVSFDPEIFELRLTLHSDSDSDSDSDS